MGRHDRQGKKRPVIDLGNLSRKHRKLYREEKKPNIKSGKDVIDDADNDDKHVNDEVASTDSNVSSDEETNNPYQQLVQTLTSKSHPQTHKDSDEESDVESVDAEIKEENISESENESDKDVENGKSEAGDVEESDGDEDSEDGDELVEETGSDDSDDMDDEIVPGFDDEDDEDDETLKESDPFIIRFETDLEDEVVEDLSGCKRCQRENTQIHGVGPAVYQWPHDKLKQKITHRKEKDLTKLHVKQSLKLNLNAANEKLCGVETDGLTPLQSGLFSVINNYQDLLYSDRTCKNGEEIRLVYCLHVLNHILKTRKRVISHNTKIKQKGEQLGVDEEFRDQGLTRPKVLMILPFRESAKRVVNTFIQLLNPKDQGFVANKNRFFKEYGLAPEDEPKTGYKPQDFTDTFAGNIDDHFRIGLSVSKKTLKLYTKFYSTDIILASPLGLRTLVGSEGDKERDYDFLNSIEMLIIDQADILMMQNWDHVLHIVKHLHLQPQEPHGVDFSRVRMWTLNGWSKYYRQSLIFRSVHIPEVTALYSKHCHNFAGRVEILKTPSNGTICQIAALLPQVFHRVDCTSYSNLPDDRFDLFVKRILPHHSNAGMSQTLIFIPSYFDFVRLRNYFQREEINYVQVCEYTKEKTVNTARNLFYHKKVPYMLYTERFHFYKRVVLRGIRHIVFYGLPQYPHLYSEMCNMLNDVKSKVTVDNQTCTVLFSKFDALRLAEVVGSDRTKQLIHSEKSVHMFVTGENN